MDEVRMSQSKPDNFAPSVALVAAWIVADKKVLFLEKCSNSLWGVPGGKVEAGETLLNGLCREVYEETDIILEPTRCAHLIDCYISKPGWNFTYHMFFYQLPSQPSVMLSAEHTNYKWVTLAEALSLPLMPGGDEIIGIFQREVKKHGIIV